jgi:hypothetical protein
MAIDKHGFDNAEESAKSTFEQYFINKLPEVYKDALIDLISSGAFEVDWEAAHAVLVSHFPEMLAESDGMTMEELAVALVSFDEEYDRFIDWVEATRDEYTFPTRLGTKSNPIYNFHSICSILSSFFYDEEYEDTEEECEDLAEEVARQIYK